MNSIILMGSKVGNNVIIGAGSIVKGEIPDNVVIAGNPARVICTLEDHYKKRKEKSIIEAKTCAQEFFEHYGRYPKQSDMGAFFPLYMERTEKALRDNNIKTDLSGDEEEDIINKFLNSQPNFASYEKFLEDVFKDDI